jgi:hypothetical protein
VEITRNAWGEYAMLDVEDEANDDNEVRLSV